MPVLDFAAVPPIYPTSATLSTGLRIAFFADIPDMELKSVDFSQNVLRIFYF